MKSSPGIKIHKSRKKNPTFHGKIFPQIPELKSIFHGILQKPDFAGLIAGSNSGGSQLFPVRLWVQKDD